MMFSVLFLLASCICGSLGAPAPLPQKMAQLTHSISDFGLNLLNLLEQKEVTARSNKNVLISPLSISSVLSTLLGGSATDTHKQLYETLGYAHDQMSEKDILSFYAELKRDLNAQLAATNNTLEVADAVAIQQGYPILATFHDVLEGELLMTKNFKSEAHKSTVDINAWVNERTHAKIPKLFDQDLDPATVMVLLNAVYFKGLWKKPFETKNTTRAPFMYHGRDGKEGELVDMMNANGHFGFARFDDGDLLEIPYQNDSLAFVVFLPKEGAVKEQSTITSLFSASGPTKMLSERLAHVRQSVEVKVHLPRFKVESSYSLNGPLSQLGIRDAFLEGKADFSRINGKRDLIVSDVAHKAFIEVNEEGSEAAAATGVVMIPTSVQIPVDFNANRPFLFMIYDKQYQLALFSGVVNKP